tara:strand:+ start:7554 stop:8198 length:645 start_codon:yes stop_codon:yes gene_type:complete
MPHLSMDQKVKNIKFYKNDLPLNVKFKHSIAIDTETMGLNINNDRLCLIQISDENGNCHIVQFLKNSYSAPNLKKILNDKKILKIFHYARFDIAVIKKNLKVMCEPIYCTKIASKLARTFTDRHGLKDLCKDLLKIDINKNSQTSDWGNDNLTQNQIEYAANDVLYLHEIKNKLDKMIKREGKYEIAKSCFKFLPTRAEFDLIGWQEKDIFQHK